MDRILIPEQPNQAIIESAKNSIALTFLGFAMVGLFYGSLSDSFVQISYNSGLFSSFAISMILALIFLSLVFGFFIVSFVNNEGDYVSTSNCIEHFSLRLVLWRSGVIPWDYAAFLSYTSDLGLTRQIGNEFRFYHDLLQEHFAQILLRKPSNQL